MTSNSSSSLRWLKIPIIYQRQLNSELLLFRSLFVIVC